MQKGLGPSNKYKKKGRNRCGLESKLSGLDTTKPRATLKS